MWRWRQEDQTVLTKLGVSGQYVSLTPSQKTAQRLRALVMLVEDSGSIPRTHFDGSQTSMTPAPGHIHVNKTKGQTDRNPKQLINDTENTLLCLNAGWVWYSAHL